MRLRVLLSTLALSVSVTSCVAITDDEIREKARTLAPIVGLSLNPANTFVTTETGGSTQISSLNFRGPNPASALHLSVYQPSGILLSLRNGAQESVLDDGSTPLERSVLISKAQRAVELTGLSLDQLSLSDWPASVPARSAITYIEWRQPSPYPMLSSAFIKVGIRKSTGQVVSILNRRQLESMRPVNMKLDRAAARAKAVVYLRTAATEHRGSTSDRFHRAADFLATSDTPNHPRPLLFVGPQQVFGEPNSLPSDPLRLSHMFGHDGVMIAIDVESGEATWGEMAKGSAAPKVPSQPTGSSGPVVRNSFSVPTQPTHSSVPRERGLPEAKAELVETGPWVIGGLSVLCLGSLVLLRRRP